MCLRVLLVRYAVVSRCSGCPGVQACCAVHHVHGRRGQACAGQAAHRKGLPGRPEQQDGKETSSQSRPFVQCVFPLKRPVYGRIQLVVLLT